MKSVGNFTTRLMFAWCIQCTSDVIVNMLSVALFLKTRMCTCNCNVKNVLSIQNDLTLVTTPTGTLVPSAHWGGLYNCIIILQKTVHSGLYLFSVHVQFVMLLCTWCLNVCTCMYRNTLGVLLITLIDMIRVHKTVQVCVPDEEFIHFHKPCCGY